MVIGIPKHEPWVGVCVVPDADDLRPSADELVHQAALTKFLLGGDKDDHHIACGMAFADHDFVDVGQAGGSDGFFKPGSEMIHLLAEKQTVGSRHQGMAAFLKKAQACDAAAVIGVKNAFVAIAPRMGHGFNGQHVAVEFGNTCQGVAHLLGFELGLQGRVGNLQCTAAASACQHAGWRAAMGIWPQHGFQVSMGDAFAAFAKAYAHLFVWKRTGDKNDLSLCGAANAAAVMRKAGDFD